MPIIQLENIHKKYILGETEVYALNSVDVSVKRGEFVAVVGPSGSGKSTMLHIAAGLDKPDQGRVKLIDGYIENQKEKHLAKIRNQNVGFVFQTFNLIPVLTVMENINYPRLINKRKTTDEAYVEDLLRDLGIWEHRHKRPNQLSGGQRQRVAIARALVNAPSVVFADEPTANLDHKTGEQIMEIMGELNEKYGVTFMFSTHDPKIMRVAKRIITIADGKITGFENVKN